MPFRLSSKTFCRHFKGNVTTVVSKTILFRHFKFLNDEKVSFVYIIVQLQSQIPAKVRNF